MSDQPADSDAPLRSARRRWTAEEQRLRELIHRRRRQILVHSVLYYQLDQTLITDAQFDRWARELAELQRAHPPLSESIGYHRAAFRGFTGATGYNLPLSDPRAISIAQHLLGYADRTRGKQSDLSDGSR